jgi:hypothetical protein
LKAMLLKNMILLSSSPFFSLSLSLKNLIIFILSCLFRQILYHLGHTPQPSLWFVFCFERGCQLTLPGLALNSQSSCLCLMHSYTLLWEQFL